jgi:hypothetical protein
LSFGLSITLTRGFGRRLRLVFAHHDAALLQGIFQPPNALRELAHLFFKSFRDIRIHWRPLYARRVGISSDKLGKTSILGNNMPWLRACLTHAARAACLIETGKSSAGHKSRRAADERRDTRS